MEFQMLCRNIQYLRKKHKLSQKEMAGRLRIGVGSLKKMEDGEIPPRLGVDFLFYVHKHFGVKPCDLVSRELTDCHTPCGARNDTGKGSSRMPVPTDSQ